MTIQQTPPANEIQIFYLGDCITFHLKVDPNLVGRAWLRTNLGHAEEYRQEIIDHTEKNAPILSWDWHDLPMTDLGENHYQIKLPLTQVGIFEAKCFFISEGQNQILWPEGENTQIKVEPVDSFCGNTMYTAFVRQFGANKFGKNTRFPSTPAEQDLIQQGYTIIPPSGKFRDLIKELDFIISELRCHIVQLLPIHPAPTTYAKMGRYGSPFASVDFFDVDPMYAEFDTQATPLDQFIELVEAVHARQAKIYIDIPVNHTGWASKEQTLHPDRFVKENNHFVSPGAWGIVWADLCKLDYNNPEVHHLMADVFLFWCRHGVDGFRCDAGYMLPLHAWRYITAKVRKEFPDTIFMLEGLGGPIPVMESLLLKGNLNWAYSELFQNYSDGELNHYLPTSFQTSIRKGTLIHFAETHDNSRLAAKSPLWAKMRTGLCALCSHTGAFGFANGVEWLATEQIDVHEGKSLNWGADQNLVSWIRRLHTILTIHPTFQPGTRQQLIQYNSPETIALLRQKQGKTLLVLCNLDIQNSHVVSWPKNLFSVAQETCFDLLTGQKITLEKQAENQHLQLAPGKVYCLSNEVNDLDLLNQVLFSKGNPLCPQKQRQEIQKIIWDIWVQFNPYQDVSNLEIEPLIEQFCNDPVKVIQLLSHNSHNTPITYWNFDEDETREVLLPINHLLFVQHRAPFSFSIQTKEKNCVQRYSTQISENCHIAILSLKKEVIQQATSYQCKAMVYQDQKAVPHLGQLLLLPQVKDLNDLSINLAANADEVKNKNLYAIFSNHRSGMALVRGAWGEVNSKYDALLAANINPEVPVDSQVMLSHCKIWCLYHGFSQEINIDCLNKFTVHPDNQASWNFEVPCGQGKRITLEIVLTMSQDDDHVQLMFLRRQPKENQANYVPEAETVQLIIRPFIDDRSCHSVTKAYTGAENIFPNSSIALENGFRFEPQAKHHLKVLCDQGKFFLKPSWEYMHYYPEDHQRGLEYHGDLFSPGYFQLQLEENKPQQLHAAVNLEESQMTYIAKDIITPKLPLETCLKEGLKRFMVKRNDAKTIIAGYPWFLDWGRDSLICLRGYIAAGYLKEAEEAILTFAKAEKDGMLPNMIRGNDYSNRDTSDAPLWFAIVLDDYIQKTHKKDILNTECLPGKTVLQVLESIVANYQKGTNNGIFMDKNSGLIFSPPHFTWMDTNYPAATPRTGYPIEIQALWWKSLTILAKFKASKTIQSLADKVKDSIYKYYHIPGQNHLADCLHAPNREGAEQAIADDACRCNQLLTITLGVITDLKMQKQIIASAEHLIIPGSIRSLANLPVNYALPVYHHNNLLNDPNKPYWGNYIGDEDTRRKPAYHNGTGWGWVFPHYIEALYLLGGEKNRTTAKTILSTITLLLEHDCLGQLPENSDGNYPHTQRGCGAQAWSMTEAYRVLTLLQKPPLN